MDPLLNRSQPLPLPFDRVTNIGQIYARAEIRSPRGFWIVPSDERILTWSTCAALTLRSMQTDAGYSTLTGGPLADIYTAHSKGSSWRLTTVVKSESRDTCEFLTFPRDAWGEATGNRYAQGSANGSFSHRFCPEAQSWSGSAARSGWARRKRPRKGR